MDRYIAYSKRLEKTVQDLFPDLKKVERFKSYVRVTEGNYGNYPTLLRIIKIKAKNDLN